MIKTLRNKQDKRVCLPAAPQGIKTVARGNAGKENYIVSDAFTKMCLQGRRQADLHIEINALRKEIDGTFPRGFTKSKF
ncbi:MAG: hypothetical protein ACFE0K_08390 [Alcanivorax sp.]|uniref:hypothetical protein n=1 Tax=Alcanivorax sp. TaxID=1872427 RepID=UPI003DA6D26D